MVIQIFLKSKQVILVNHEKFGKKNKRMIRESTGSSFCFYFSIGHDNRGFLSDWFLERVEIDVPKYGRTWVFPSGKWISKSKGDRELEIELFPKDEAALIYNPSNKFFPLLLT